MTDSRGRLLVKTKSVRKAYENAIANAKLDDVNFHTLRHTFASWGVMRGVSLKELESCRVIARSP
jgi:integrase